MAWRVIEMLIGAWVILARSVLPASDDDAGSRVHDLAWGACVIVLALAACSPRLRVASIGVAAAAIELALLGRFGEPYPRSPVAQSYVLTGLLLLMICPIPTRFRPPSAGAAPSIESAAAPGSPPD